MLSFQSFIRFILLSLHVFADKDVYYIVGHGGEADSGKSKWEYKSNVNFFSELGQGICQADVQLRNLIDLEMGVYATVRGRVKWAVTKDTNTYNQQPKPNSVVDQAPKIWVYPIENPYGGVFHVKYDDNMKDVKGVKQLIEWPDYKTNSNKGFSLRDIVSWIEKKPYPAGEIFWLACLTRREPTKLDEDNGVKFPENLDPRNARAPKYKEDMKALKTEIKEFVEKFKKPKDYDTWYDDKFSKDQNLKAAFKQIDDMIKKDLPDDVYEDHGNQLNSLYTKEITQGFFGYQHLRVVRSLFEKHKKALEESYNTWKDLEAGGKVEATNQMAMAVFGDSYPSEGQRRSDASGLDGDEYAFDINDGSGYHHHHAHHGRAREKRSDRYYHQYGEYNHHDHTSDYTLIAVMTSFIGIGACCLCVIIAVICGVVSGRYYYMNKNQPNFKHNRGQYGRIDVDEDQV